MTGSMFRSDDFRSIVQRFDADARKANLALVDALRRIASDKRATPAQISPAWILAQKPLMSPIPGTTKHTRLEENVAAVAVQLTSDDLANIERTLSAITIHGDRYPARLQQFVNR